MSIFATDVPVGRDRVASAVADTLADHRGRLPGPVDAEHLLDRVRDVELRGFGGALFPVARKWTSAIEAGGRGIVVANGAESEPASAKDAALLQLRPHLVLDGLAATARATSSTEAIIWLHQGAHFSRTSIERAIIERRANGVVEVPMRVVMGPARYLSGESSAVVRALSGGPALPRTTSAPASVSGIDGRPTLVHNVETLARVALLGAGVPYRPGRLLTVTTPAGFVVVDADPEATLGSLVSRAGAGAVSALLLGGYGGSWHRWDSVVGHSVSALEPLLSAGIVMTLPRSHCGIATTARIMRYLADSSARQCGPCLFGLDELADVIERVAAGRGRRSDADRLRQISADVAGRGACHHPDGAVRMLGSALTAFEGDLSAHRRGGRCDRRHSSPVPGQEAA